jgi:DNA-binding SARP family transcriptional activator/pimeloyl-ACP methyl ester carboxylesterase
MEIRLLGLVEATIDGRPVALGAAKQRAVLAMLALRANAPVSTDRLIEGLWGEEPPPSARKVVQLHVSQLRKLLDGDATEIVTRGRGYELRLPAESVDALRFERLITAAERGEGTPNGAAREALSLWRGPALDDLADEPFAAAEMRRLEELWLRARELDIAGALAAGEHAIVLGELQELVDRHPLRERLHAQLMLALYRCGRQAEALEAYRQARAVLVAEVGVEPGPELRRLHEAILQQESSLDPTAGDHDTTSSRQGPAGDDQATPAFTAELGLVPGPALREPKLAIARHDPAPDQVPVLRHVSPAAAAGARRHPKPRGALPARDRPETRYAWSGEVSIAYQVYGDGPIDIVLVPGWVSHLEVAWEHAGYCRFMDRLASFARVVVYDKRGTGLSDPVGAAPAFDPRLDDLSAVVETAGCRRPVLFGWSEGATIAALFTATHPDLVRRLILYGTYARGPWAEDYPFGLDQATLDAFTETIRGTWGEGVSLTVLGPHRVDDDELRRWWGRFERMSASPSIAASVFALNARMDMRELLPSIHVPTLVVHRVGDMLPIEGARYTAERIPGARLVELPGADHWPWLAGGDDVLEPVEEFVTGKRSSPEPDRVLATVLFSDIVDSTARAAAIGDSEWRMVLMRHDLLVREAIERQRGVIVKSTGDGALARFDRPTAAMEAAREITSALPDRLGLQARVGLHTGEIELLQGDVVGITVHVAARIGALASPGEVLASRTIRDLVLGSGLALREAGTHALKGVPDTWELFALADGP